MKAEPDLCCSCCDPQYLWIRSLSRNTFTRVNEHRRPQCLLTLGRSTSPPLDQFPVRVCSCPLCIMNRL